MSSSQDAGLPPSFCPHAFHLALPAHHRHPVSNVPYVTLHAHRQARGIWQLVRELEVTEEMFREEVSPDDEDDGSPTMVRDVWLPPCMRPFLSLTASSLVACRFLW